MKTSGAGVKESKEPLSTDYWWHEKKSTCKATAPKPGERCPTCGNGTLAYDGLFLLTCSHCGKAAESGAFT